MTTKILKYVFFNALRSKVVMGYALVLLLLSGGIAYMQEDPARSLASMLSVVLLFIPLFSIILGTIQYYNSREFIELLMTQPIKRKAIFLAEYLGLATVLSLAFLIGAGVPLLIFGITVSALYLLWVGVLLTFIFTGLAFLASVFTNDKAKGIGLSLILWFYFSIVYDAIIMGVLLVFSDYPLEKAVMVLSTLNPVDLSRIIILLNLDISALMGYTGALYQKFFGSFLGIGVAIAGMLLWVWVPAKIALRKFATRDF